MFIPTAKEIERNHELNEKAKKKQEEDRQKKMEMRISFN